MIRVALLLLLGCSSNSFLLWWSGDWWWDLFEKCHMSDLLRGQSKHWPSGDTTDRFLEKAEETLERRSFWMMIVLSFVRISALISFFFFFNVCTAAVRPLTPLFFVLEHWPRWRAVTRVTGIVETWPNWLYCKSFYFYGIDLDLLNLES